MTLQIATKNSKQGWKRAQSQNNVEHDAPAVGSLLFVRRQHDMNTIHAQLKAKHDKTIAVEIPIDEEIERIAMRMHTNGKPCLETILGWKVFYRPRQDFSYSSVSVDPFTGKRDEESASAKALSPAEFTFGHGAPWKIVLSWSSGDDRPPTWFRYEDKLYVPSQHLEQSAPAQTGRRAVSHRGRPRIRHLPGVKTRIQNSRVVALLALTGCFALYAAGAATFTFKSGTKFEGDVVEVKGTNSVVVRSAKDGKIYTIILSMLTDADQYLITGHWPGVSGDHEPSYQEILRAERVSREAGKTLPEQAEDDSSGQAGHPSRITGAFGLKLGQVFDPKYATGTNQTPESMTSKGEFIKMQMVGYNFKPRHPLPNFERYEVGVTPCSNYVYSIGVSADFESFSSAREEQEKLLAALQEKYGKATFDSRTNGVYRSWSYTIKQGTREVWLSLSRDTDPISLFLDYGDTALHSQAEREQAEIEAANPERKAQRKKLEKQL